MSGDPAISGKDESPAGKPGGSRSSLIIALLPLVLFLGLAGIFYKQLAAGGSSQDIPSALIGKLAPKIDMEPLEGLGTDDNPFPTLTANAFEDVPANGLALVNVWASWCAPCRIEHPLLVQLGENERLRIYGINHKDTPQNARRFLGQLGNPYDKIGVDPRGQIAIEWGVYGIPETFVVSPDGEIIAKHVGALTPEVVQKLILSRLE